jgi:[acyl-carrier-protein] S-malonyltransferase
MENEPRMGTAIIFPGIGESAFADVARFMLINPVARSLVARADEALGYSLVDRYRETPGAYTEVSRTAFLVNCLALADWSAREYGLSPGFCTGPSFGGSAAAVYSGALDFGDAVRLTSSWGRYLEEFFSGEYRDLVTQSFARIQVDRLEEITAELAAMDEWHDIACHVDDDFHMLTVRESALEWLQKRIRAVGGLPLYVMRPPMHSSRFKPLRDLLARELVSGLEFADPVVPVISDHDGEVLRHAAQVRELLLDAIVRPVRWPTAMATLVGLGVGKLVVAGQDGLWGRVPCATEQFEVMSFTPELAMRPRERPAPAQRGPEREVLS